MESNGFISFGTSLLYTGSSYFWSSFKIIAPFWADIDQTLYGSVSFRTNLSMSDDRCIQYIIKDVIEKKFLEYNFEVRSSLVATYDDVHAFGNNEV